MSNAAERFIKIQVNGNTDEKSFSGQKRIRMDLTSKKPKRNWRK